MPNWCLNYLFVDGEEKDIGRLKRDVKSDEFDLTLSSLRPFPENIFITDNDSDTLKWYEWCMKNWGTERDVEGKMLSDGESQLEYGFESANDPPVAWLKRISMRYPRLFFRLKYEERNAGFLGFAKVQNGRVDERILDTDEWFNKPVKFKAVPMFSISEWFLVGIATIRSQVAQRLPRLRKKKQ